MMMMMMMVRAMPMNEQMPKYIASYPVYHVAWSLRPLMTSGFYGNKSVHKSHTVAVPAEREKKAR